MIPITAFKVISFSRLAWEWDNVQRESIFLSVTWVLVNWQMSHGWNVKQQENGPKWQTHDSHDSSRRAFVFLSTVIHCMGYFEVRWKRRAGSNNVNNLFSWKHFETFSVCYLAVRTLKWEYLCLPWIGEFSFLFLCWIELRIRGQENQRQFAVVINKRSLVSLFFSPRRRIYRCVCRHLFNFIFF